MGRNTCCYEGYHRLIMSNQTQEPSVALNSRTIAIVVGLITIIGATSAAFDKVHSYDLRLTRIEDSYVAIEAERKQLVNEIKSMNSDINLVNVNLKEIKVTLDLMLKQRSAPASTFGDFQYTEK